MILEQIITIGLSAFVVIFALNYFNKLSEQEVAENEMGYLKCFNAPMMSPLQKDKKSKMFFLAIFAPFSIP